ncbi:MAG: hypothetical protein ACREOK_00495 [Gemmatimonadaceae bacterium]
MKYAMIPLMLFAVAACSDASGPSLSATAGTYAAVQDADRDVGGLVFRTTTDGAETDWLERGATIDVVLRSDGTTEGRLFIPDIDVETGEPQPGTDFDESLAGSWTISGNRVSLDHAADTFLRDMDFIVNGSTLTGTATFDGVEIQVVLQRLAD